MWGEWECIAFHAIGRGLCDPYTPMVVLTDLQRLPRRPTAEISAVAGGPGSCAKAAAEHGQLCQV